MTIPYVSWIARQVTSYILLLYENYQNFNFTFSILNFECYPPASSLFGCGIWFGIGNWDCCGIRWTPKRRHGSNCRKSFNSTWIRPDESLPLRCSPHDAYYCHRKGCFQKVGRRRIRNRVEYRITSTSTLKKVSGRNLLRKQRKKWWSRCKRFIFYGSIRYDSIEF